MLLIGCTLLSSFHLVRLPVAEGVHLAIKGLGRDRAGVLHLCKCFSQWKEHRGAVPTTDTGTTAEQNAPTAVSTSQHNTCTSVCKLGLSQSEPPLYTSANRKGSEALLTFTFPDIRAAWLHSQALVLLVCHLIISNVPNIDFCKKFLESSSNPHFMSSVFSPLCADTDWQSSLLAIMVSEVSPGSSCSKFLSKNAACNFLK